MHPLRLPSSPPAEPPLITVEELLCRSWGSLVTLAGRLVGSGARRSVDPEDLAQETALALWRRFALAEPRLEPALRRWAQLVLRHAAVDAARRGRRAPLSLTAEDAPEVGLRPAEPDPFEVVAQDEQAGGLRAALAQLPAVQRRAIELRWWEGLSFAAIGARLGRSENAAQLLHARGLARLRQMLRGSA